MRDFIRSILTGQPIALPARLMRHRGKEPSLMISSRYGQSHGSMVASLPNGHGMISPPFDPGTIQACSMRGYGLVLIEVPAPAEFTRRVRSVNFIQARPRRAEWAFYLPHCCQFCLLVCISTNGAVLPIVQGSNSRG